MSPDIAEDREGEYFEIVRSPLADPEVAVLDVQTADRHLLLLVRDGGEKQKFLCGHDERHWFVAAFPNRRPSARSARQRKHSSPPQVLAAQSRQGLRAKARNRRKNAAYRRQGEWFFLPVPDFPVDESLVLRDEPIRRGDRGKPHWVEFCYRTGGETVYVCRRHPNGVTAKEYQRILTANPSEKEWGWQPMRRNAGVFARGNVRHADHEIIVLHGWHQVLMNTEREASDAKRRVPRLTVGATGEISPRRAFAV